MNDFLQNLRTGNTKTQRTGMTRKKQDNVYQSSNQRFQYNNGHPGNHGAQAAPGYPAGQATIPSNDDSSIASLLLATIGNLSRQVETLAANQGQMVIAQEKTANVIERQTIAIEKILAHIDILPDSWVKK